MIILDGKSKTQTMGGLKGSYADTPRPGARTGVLEPISPIAGDYEIVKRALKAGAEFMVERRLPRE